ncbi:DUF1289 domain-containing protein [Pseudomarimonas arenosa]|uniref:DUF1289 domain-containing protein n=1 Tax=Pseudomarimonas arenosa TaxID=2774145 RepID=A0AAW3ZIC8_9GAMM|nr:DUF1289 domain-containing protein [Pseudomarimonas arenosa]MBD8525751.1 DUF1289 domain-containing protein [Pseudomarimonas arenosa]
MRRHSADSEDPRGQDEPRSPCVRRCCLDDQDICCGCGRTLQEILDWHGANAERQRQILALARQRLEKRGHRPALDP